MEVLHAAVKAELGEDGLPTAGGAEVPAAEHGHGWLVPVKAQVKTEIKIHLRETLVNVEIKSETIRPDSTHAALKTDRLPGQGMRIFSGVWSALVFRCSTVQCGAVRCSPGCGARNQENTNSQNRNAENEKDERVVDGEGLNMWGGPKNNGNNKRKL